MHTKNAIFTMITTIATISTIAIITVTTVALFTMNSAHAFVDEDQALFFDTNPDLFYKIGGVNRIRQPLTPDTHIAIGLKGNANLGYSCGEFDISAAFSNLMDNFKNGGDDAVNSVVGTINAGITALPALAIQRAMPGVYDMFQEYKLDAETDINLARTSCEEMEAQIARGENPYANFLQEARAETWKQEAYKGTTITQAKEISEHSSADNGITDFGEKVGVQDNHP